MNVVYKIVTTRNGKTRTVYGDARRAASVRTGGAWDTLTLYRAPVGEFEEVERIDTPNTTRAEREYDEAVRDAWLLR